MKRVNLPQCEGCLQIIRQDYLLLSDRRSAWHEDCAEEALAEQAELLRKRRMERYLAEFRAGQEPGAPFDETLPAVYPAVYGGDPEPESPDGVGVVCGPIGMVLTGIEEIDREILGGDPEPTAEPAEETPAERGEMGAPEAETVVPMRQCPDCPEGHLLPVTRDHFILKTDGKTPAFSRCKPHHNARQRQKRADRKAPAAPLEPEAGAPAEFSRENPEEAHGDHSGDYISAEEFGEMFRAVEEGPEKAPEEPTDAALVESVAADPDPATPEADGEITGAECARRREALKLDHSALGLAVEAGPVALKLFEAGSVPLAPYIKKRLKSVLEYMERNGVPADLRQTFLSWQVEAKLASPAGVS